ARAQSSPGFSGEAAPAPVSRTPASSYRRSLEPAVSNPVSAVNNPAPAIAAPAVVRPTADLDAELSALRDQLHASQEDLQQASRELVWIGIAASLFLAVFALI